MENNIIQNNINNINIDNDKQNNKNTSNKEEMPKNTEKDTENQNIVEKKEKIKLRLNFSVIIDHLREISDKPHTTIEVEFDSNILLMSSEVNQSNKISCLTLVSYVNHKKNNSLYIYYLNKKIFKYLQIQKGIESFIYIRTLYRAAFFLEKDKNFFYAYKYIKEADILSKNSKINQDSINLLNKLKKSVTIGISDYLDIYIKKFRDIESPNNLDEEKYNKLKKLMNDLKENKYEIKDNEQENKDDYLYVINKKWFDKAYNFIKDYINEREKGLKRNYFNKVFEPSYTYHSYFDEETTSKNNKDTKNDFYSFPGIIDNYSISDWVDFWFDPLNEDENNYIQQNLEYNKDYFLLEKTDFEFLQNFFGVSNIIKRKKNNLDFVIVKAIIFDKRFAQKENSFLLRRRNLQIRKNSKISDFKEKVLRCVEDSLKKISEEKNNNDNKKEKEDNKKNKNNDNKNDGNNDDDNKKIVIKIDENQIGENNEDKKKDNNKYNINLYLLEKEKKDILIEMCLSLVNGISQYESLDINNINISDDDNITKLLMFFNKAKYILIIEIQQNEEPIFLKSINNNDNKYICSICKKEIPSIENSYKCNICHFSIFCSEECANKDIEHKRLDNIYSNNYLVEEFNLKRFLKKDLKDILQPDQLKGLVGLSNLGNTCYMNSALQCLSNTFDLTKYFLYKYFENDINRGNKLGSNGSIANEYYNLIKSMWCGTDPIIAPRKFISSFQDFKRQFKGYRQQDSQEFLSILLDQLHEDLNRITNKPYIELLEKQPYEDDMTASKRWWDLHKKREDSIIIDLFNGQLKSETTCQVCHKSSITYDPFMFLCLPLPKSKPNLFFKIFCGIECKTFEFQYFETCTLLDLKNKAFEFIKETKQTKTEYFDLEIVQLDSNKKIIQILSANVIDGKNFQGKTELKSLLVNRNEIIFFEKNMNKNEEDYIKIFVYPIQEQKAQIYGNGRLKELEFLSYPLFFQLKHDIKIKEFITKVFSRLSSLNFFEMEKANYYNKKKEIKKIIDLNIIHGKETKKEGFWSYLSIEDTCKYCKNSNESLFYCSISNFTSEDKTLHKTFSHFKSPIILVATSECYNLSGDGLVYLESKLFIDNSQESNVGKSSKSIQLKDCLDLYGEDIDLKDDDMWYCSQCKKHQISKQKLKIYKSPLYLIIQIKRFNIKKNVGCESTFTGEKNETFVNFPINDLNLSEYIVGPEKDKNIKYDLYGLVQHFGSLNGGHYTAICKKDETWITFNDSQLDYTKNPVTKNAYILFYKRKDLETNKVNIEQKEKNDVKENTNLNIEKKIKSK